MANERSTDMATIVNMEACAIVCSSQGIILPLNAINFEHFDLAKNKNVLNEILTHDVAKVPDFFGKQVHDRTGHANNDQKQISHAQIDKAIVCIML